jgi:hypothetical protein
MAVVEIPDMDTADVHLLQGAQQVAARETALARSSTRRVGP